MHRKMKYVVWLVGGALLLAGLFVVDLGTEANTIQLVGGIPMVWALGEYIEKRSRIHHILENHSKNQKTIMKDIQNLHEKIDSKEEK